MMRRFHPFVEGYTCAQCASMRLQHGYTECMPPAVIPMATFFCDSAPRSCTAGETHISAKLCWMVTDTLQRPGCLVAYTLETGCFSRF